MQEVVDRSKQSLRSFYQHFDGKHELLLALFEDAMSKSADELRALAAEESDPLERLRVVIQELFDSSRPDLSGTQRPLFSDFAMRLLVSHPAEMRVAHAPLLRSTPAPRAGTAPSAPLVPDSNRSPPAVAARRSARSR